MNQNGRLRVLIVAISPADEGIFVPLIYGNLRSWADADPFLQKNVVWLEPVMLPVNANELENIDVLGVSVYEWNSFFSYSLCKSIKEKNSTCVIVAGGPEVAWRESCYFKEHPYIDAVVPGDGEIPFAELLRSMLNGGSVLNVEGVIANPAIGESEFLPASRLNLDSKPSPWLTLKDFWRLFFKKYDRFRLAAAYESSRGCPYGCIYCDWGGASKGLVSFIPEKTAIAEMDFIQQELRPFFMFWTDANLGIASRDIGLVEHFAENKRRYGSPFSLYYNCVKKDFSANLRIAEHLRSAGLLTKYVLALQHTDPEVLATIRRKNLSLKQVDQLAKKMRESDVPLFVQFIIGCPQDSFDKWLRNYTVLMEMGVHGEYRAYPFGLFPNSEAASPQYMLKCEIDAPERTNYVAFFTLKKEGRHYALSRSRYVLGSRGVSRDDYGEMLKLSLLISACHDHGLTRFIAVGMRYRHGMAFEDFYRKLYAWFYSTELCRTANQFVERWLWDDDASFMVHSPLTGSMVEPEEALVMKLYAHWDEFYEALNDFASQNGIPASLLKYQQNMLYRPNVTPEKQIEIPTVWAVFFDNSLDESGIYKANSELLHFPHIWFKANTDKQRYRLFYTQMIQHNIPGAKRAVFKQLSNIQRI